MDDPEKRIADLERQLSEAKRIAELERQLADAKAAAPPLPTPGNTTTFTFGPTNGTTGRAANHFGQVGPTGIPDSRLAVPPRRIPAAFWLAELVPFRWWYVFTLFMVGVSLFVLWFWVPAAFAVLGVLTLLAIYGFQLAGTTKRFALLKWGQVAQVTGTQILEQGTYYSGTTWHNAPLPIAHGWKVMRPQYSGPSTKTRIRYTVNGAAGELMVSGREYIDGVVLADPRRPARALCVTSFTYDLDRDESGNWIGRIRPRLKVGMAVWLIMVIGWLGLVAFSATGHDRVMAWVCNNASTSGIDCSKYTSSSSDSSSAEIAAAPSVTSVPQGGDLRVAGDDSNKTVACNDGNLTLYGSGSFEVTGHCANLTVGAIDSQVQVESADTIKIQGYDSTVFVGGRCASLTVSAYGNDVNLDSVDTINISGRNNTVSYHSGSPETTDTGQGNTVVQVG